MTPRTALLVTAVTLAAAAGCAGRGEDVPRVVVTTDILGDVTRNVVGGQAEVTVLMRPGSDPHSFGVSAQDAALIEDADLIVHNGLGLEEGVLRHVEAARRAGVPALAVGEGVEPIRFTADGSDPARRRVHAIDLTSGKVVRTTSLPQPPNELTGTEG
ncbi:metal ABC transporter solute-binding protein, Zn/Mn family [Nonomuraea pusilla]|uniref:metal ABC transporter solute-binding protein, Zn/Mn family n=1 Tax=Nonomuraea pusilla TaxID=46177 RepID=UPI003D9EB173